MKQFIKMLCLTLFAAILLSTVGYQGQTAALEATDETAFEKLEAFGILETGDDLQYEDVITRGTFLRYAARLMGDFPAVAGENPFSDLAVEDDCYEEALLFSGLGYISGEKGSRFRAEDAITAGEASKILIGVLGYGEVAARRLSFPSGYITLAQRLELFEGVKTGESFDAHDMAMLMLNTLEAPLLDLESLLSEGADYQIRYTNDRAETLLSQRFSIYPTEGLLDSNAYSSIYGKSTVPSESVSIDGAVFKTDSRSAAMLLGYSVEGYYQKGTTEPHRLVYVEPKLGANTVVSLRGKDINADSITESGFSYYNDETDKTTKIKTERALVLIYNGVQTTYNKSYLTKAQAYITLIDNDRDGRVEVISVMDYRSIVVASIGRDGVVTDELGGASVELDVKNSSYDLFMENEQGTVALSELVAGDVLSYAVPLGSNPTVKFVYVSQNSQSGTITGVDEDGLWLDGAFYEADEACLDNAVAGHTGTFLIDYFGRIVHQTIERDVVFGYLNQLAKENFAVRARIFTENSRWVELKFKESFRLNDMKIKAEDFYRTYGSSTSLYRQLVTYTVNDNAEIISMNFAVTSTPWTDLDQSLIESGTFRLSAHEAKAQYRAGMTSLGNNILLTAQTKLFMIPQQAENSVADEEEFYIMASDSLVADREYSNIYAYNSDSMHQAEACVLIGNSMTVDATSKLLLVESTAIGAKEDGGETYVINGMFMGANMSIQTKDKAVLDNIGGLSGGDVVQIVYNNDGYVVSVTPIYKSSGGAEQQFLSGSLYALTTICAGRVERHDTSIKRIAIDYKDGIGIFTTGSLTNVYLYHTKSGRTERINVEDIRTDDYVLGQVRYFNTNQMIVFRP